MSHPYRWFAFALPLAVALVGAATTAAAFSDSNAALKEEALDRSQRVVVVGKATPPAQATTWVPVSSKRLDRFQPVLPSQGRAPQRLAQASAVPAQATKR